MDEIREESYLKNNLEEVPVERRPVVPQEAVLAETPIEEKSYRCVNCKVQIPDSKAKKEPTNYVREEDGTISKEFTRFSVFCPTCQAFLCLVADEDARLLNNMLYKNK